VSHPLLLRFAPLLVLTDRTLCAPRSLGDVVRSCVERGARAVVLREKDLPRGERVELAAALRALLEPVDGCLLAASDPTIPADGVHLAAADPFPADHPGVVGRSCHDLAEVRAAQAEGCDYVTLSPIHTTSSKPGYGPALGVVTLRSVAQATTVPIYALGGITTPASAHECLDAGAAGVAVMGSAMRDPNDLALMTAGLTASAGPERS
jgi:thiamine-phosphate diphosphorylase